jgi:hypothetical protein
VATDSEAEVVYRAEAILEQELPTRKLSLKEAQDLVDRISHAEDIDPPKVVHLPISRQFDALAVPHERLIVVRTSRPTQLTVVHEMAHFIGDFGHCSKFRTMYLRLVHTHISIDHFLALESLIHPRRHLT